ncbi:MAG: pyridoxal phosphate-dependent aminotransferase [Planctomycetota bacterium]
MPISREVEDALGRSSWIRRMFEEGNRLKKKHGAENVFDFSLGNPDLPPPDAFIEKLRELTQAEPGGIHRYMPNAGWPQVREKIASHLAKRTGLDYTGSQVLMTVGAGGGLNVVLKALIDPDDEVVILAPYFVEYVFYVANHRGKTVVAETDATFGPDPESLRASITERTRVVMINSPNNPTGRVYTRAELDAVAAVLTEKSEEYGRPIYLITDEPYRRIVYPGYECPEVPPTYPHTILVTSHSKDLGLAGERIGIVAISPDAADADKVADACTFTNRTLGFVNAPSLFQLAVADCQDASVDVATYQERRDILVPHLKQLGFDLVDPGGAFYLFPRSPIPDETEFVRRLMEECILVVPGRGFGRPGHFRVSFAVPTEVIERSLPAWERVASEYPQQQS